MMNYFNGDNYRGINNARTVSFHSVGFDLNGKRVLDCGSGDGSLAQQALVPLGAIVTCAEARVEHLDAMKVLYPDLFSRAQQVDLDHDFPTGEYDLIFAMGLFYHLASPAMFLLNCAKHAPILVLETVIDTAMESSVRIVEEGAGYDQAYNGFGARPTVAWLGNALKEAFGHVYTPVNVPDFPDFKLMKQPVTARIVAVASREPLRLSGLQSFFADKVRE